MWDVGCWMSDVVRRIRGWFRRMRGPYYVVEEDLGPRPPAHVGCRCYLDEEFENEIWAGMLVDMAEEIDRQIVMGERERELDRFWAELYEENFGEDCSDN